MIKKEQRAGLLNIKQAAGFLNVSEVSLRRWTRTGDLACLRVGPKQERRFRLEDLQAFLKLQVVPSVANSPSRTKSDGHVMLGGIHIDHGSHICCLYENDLGRVNLAVPFLAEGLDRGDLCFLVATQKAKNHILDCLKSVCGNLKDEIAKGNLLVLEGTASGSAMYTYFENAFVEGTRAGGRSLRVLGDMAWAIEKGLDSTELMEFELRYNQFLAHKFPVVSLCQYDTRKFSGTGILDALRCHEDTFRYPLSRFLG